MSTKQWGWSATAAIASVVLLMILAVGGGVTGAQEVSGSPTATIDHPAHIHTASCAVLGDIAYPLNDLVPPALGETPPAGMDTVPPGAEIDSMSATTIQLPDKPHADFDHFVAGGHAINIHLSAEEIGTYIACGDIAGHGSGHQLQLELHELNGSGYQGQATLTDNGDGTMTVTVVLTHTEGVGTPVASPSA
jgi:hypothetical protein